MTSRTIGPLLHKSQEKPYLSIETARWNTLLFDLTKNTNENQMNSRGWFFHCILTLKRDPGSTSHVST